MKKSPQLGISTRIIMVLTLLLFSFSLPLSIKDGRAIDTTPTSENPPVKSQSQPTGSLIQAADWSDNFDSYPTGVALHGLGGWKGWFNAPAATAFTSATHARSAPNSVNITTTSDMVHEYDAVTSGEWVYTTWQYIPSDFLGESYFILLNQYDDAGTAMNWSVQVSFSSGTNLVLNTGATGGSLPLIKDSWVQLRLEFDLTNDTSAFYYGGQLLYQGTWTNEVSGLGINNLAAINLFANGATPIYYDDFSLAPKLGWSDDFDSYPTGVSLHGLGGWKGWGNDPAFTAFTTSAHAHSSPNSVNILGTADLVHEYSGYTTGRWVYTAWQYIPSAFTGQSYFILLNQYDDAGTTSNWSVQVYFDGSTNLVGNDGLA
ncbi:MAG TPA: hypothetical protein PLH64_05520 [Anaerolineaceae bacterium]|nr:hypothetical protein [Anaerolineaceae bacterium]